MEYRCPACNGDLAARRVTGRVIPRMEIDCPFCLKRIEMNVHPVESAVMTACFVGFVAFAVLFYALKNDAFLVLGLACLAPSALLPLIERRFFRGWPRYRLKQRG
jgi:hypothetical protein